MPYNLVFKFEFKLRNIIYIYQVISLSVINTNDSHPHPRIHTREKTFACKICDVEEDSEDDIVRHIKMLHQFREITNKMVGRIQF